MICSDRFRGSGWWKALACLPLAFVIQTMFLTCLCHEARAMGDAAVLIDLAILLRCLAGLMWQPRSNDWQIYLAFQFLAIPLCWWYFSLWDRMMPL